MSAAPPEWRHLPLYWDPDFPLVICQPCRFALGPAQASAHLWLKHQIPLEQRQGLTGYLRKHGFQEPAKVAPRPGGSPEHRALRTYEGFACRACDEYCTIDLSNMLKHLRLQHADIPRPSRRTVDQLYEDVYLQTWTHSTHRPYWVVARAGRVLRVAENRSSHEHLQALREREKTRRAAIQAAASDHSGPSSFESLRPWIERTQWDETYRGLSRDLLQRLTEMPAPSSSDRDHCLWSRPGEVDLVSPAGDERKLLSIAHAVDSLLDRCEETMRHTGRPILCWLRTFQPSPCYPKPFVFLARSTSTDRYRRYWKRFLIFVFRCYRLGPEIRRQRLRVKFRREQLDRLHSIWSLVSEDRVETPLTPEVPLAPSHCPRRKRDNRASPISDHDHDSDWDREDDEGSEEDETDYEDEDETDGDTEDETDQADGSPESSDQPETISLPSKCLEQLFQLNIMFITDEFTDGQPSSSLLVYFSGILGFSPDAQSFQPAKSFTPHLSALIYIQRLLFLEYALPYRAYPEIGWNRRPHRGHLDRLNQIRTQYMIAGALTPLAEFQSLRDYGRKMVRTDPPSFLLRWSEDGQTVFFGDDDGELKMETFRRLASHFLDQAESLCKTLMLEYSPSFDLATVRDDLTNTQGGFSFVQHVKNQLADAYLELADRACTYQEYRLYRQGQWNRKSIYLYLEQDERFRKLLMGILYTTGGQVPRIPELSSLECVNGPSTERGFYVWNGSMIYLTRHHKAKRSTNREFYVVRFLPARGGRLLYQYLVYIRPFVQMLRREMHMPELGPSEKSPESYLFQPKWHGPPWQSPQFRGILQQATEQAWKRRVTTQQYRQLAIGITEKHVREVFEPFNRHDDRTAAADRNVVFAWQSGHRPVQRNHTYGLDGAFPNQLQPALLRAYEWASTRWHEFLGLASKHIPSEGQALQTPSFLPDLSAPGHGELLSSAESSPSPDHEPILIKSPETSLYSSVRYYHHDFLGLLLMCVANLVF
jgi:hypothetical protein